MRLNEITSNSGYYTLGDQYAIELSNASGWDGHASANASTDTNISNAINSIPKGSVVVVSLGQNDAKDINKRPEQIASKLNIILDLIKNNDLIPVYMLFPSGNNERLKSVRDAIKGIITVPTIDLEAGTASSDKATIPSAIFNLVATRISSKIKPVGYQPNKIIGGNISSSGISPATVATYLASKGLDRNQILGILVNMRQESNFNPAAFNSKERSGGLFQHHLDRLDRMIAHTGGGNKWKSNWQGQIDYALSEPQARKYKNIKFNTPEQASEWWTRKFEVPARVNYEVKYRISNYLKDMERYV